MSAVESLIGELAKRGVVARWEGTGGNCMAVVVYFGPAIRDGVTMYEIMVTDREDVFTPSDHDSDEDVYGFHAGLYVYDDDYERVGEDIVLYRTAGDAGDAAGQVDPEAGVKVVDLAPEIMACADHLEFVVRVVEAAELAAVVGKLKNAEDWQLSW